jgi:hypothetical protein
VPKGFNTPPFRARYVDFYVRYFAENIKQDNDNPTVGIILCSEKNGNALVFGARTFFSLSNSPSGPIPQTPPMC